MENKQIGANRKDVFDFAKEKFGQSPEYLWQKFPDYAVLRCTDNKKWYAVIGSVEKSKIGLKGAGKTDVLVIKCDPQARDVLLHEKGIIPAYHMNKERWISAVLDGSVRKKLVLGLIEESFDLVKPKSRKTVLGESL